MINPLIDLAQERIRKNECPTCGIPLLPDLESRTYGGSHDGEWDGHTYKGNCKCMPENVRLSIG